MDEIKVFVSSSAELEDERQIVRKGIKQIPKFEPIMFEDFGARTEAPRKAYLEEVKKSDIYLGLLHDKFSNPTSEEYYEATDLGKDILIYVKELREGKREEILSRFIEKLKENHTISEFRDVTDLEEKVKNDLLGLLARNYLERQSQKIKKQDIVGIDDEKVEMALNFISLIGLAEPLLTEEDISYRATKKLKEIWADILTDQITKDVIKKGKKIEEIELEELEKLGYNAIIFTIFKRAKKAIIREEVLVTYTTILWKLIMGKGNKEEFLSGLKKVLIEGF